MRQASLEGAPACRRARPLLGTLVDISVWADDARRAEAAVREAFAEVAQVHRLMSFHDEASDIARINRAGVGEFVEVDRRTARVLHAASMLWRESACLFDCTIGRELTDNGWLPGLPGEPLHSRDMRSRTGRTWRDIEPVAPWRLAGQHVVKRSACLIDLGGIAKGYAVDRATALLAGRGLAGILVNAGGDLRYRGRGTARIDLRDPGDPSHIALSTCLGNRAMASSAASALQAPAGVRGSALLDGVTREPIGPGAGASVVAPNCMLADALTKVVLASGDPSHPLLARYRATCVLYRGAGRQVHRGPADGEGPRARDGRRHDGYVQRHP